MKHIISLLLALAMLTLAACGEKETAPAASPETETPNVPAAVVPDEPAAPDEAPETPRAAEEPEEPEATDVIFTFDGVELPVPTELEPLLIIESEPEAWNEHWTPLISFSHRASVEAYERDNSGDASAREEGIGWICTVMRLDRVGFEDWLSGERSGSALFAVDDAEHYYLISTPTDVRVYEPDAAWTALNEWAMTLPRTIITRNALTAYDAHELFDSDYTYQGEHVDLGCRFPGQPMDLIILSLSQPATRGEGGIWCVERARYVYSEYSFTDTQLVFPVSFGVDETSADYYARMQAECDAGGHPELLTAAGAALDYAKRAAWIFGEDVSNADFELIETAG